MGYRTSRKDDKSTETDRSDRRKFRNDSRQERSSDWSQQMTLEKAEDKYGMTVPDRDTMFELQRAEASTPRRLPNWIEEGMPVDVMGTPSKMEAFRERQKERPPEVPTNIERQHRRSVLRSEDAAGETGPAGESDVPDSVRKVITAPGQSLDPEVQRAMEDRMGESFDDVQIHTGPQAANACESINARAFTVGNHVAFNRGEYDPSSPEGQHVLAHELAHVRQQTGGAVSLLPQEDVELDIDPDPALEKEAEATAQRVMRGWKLEIQRMRHTDVHVQRMAEWSEHPLTEEDEQTDVSLFELAKKMGGGAGSAAIISGLTEIVKSGGVEQALQNPEGVVVVAGVTVPATVLVTGWKNLIGQLDVKVIRQAFAAAGKEDLYEKIKKRIGLGSETGEYPGDQ